MGRKACPAHTHDAGIADPVQDLAFGQFFITDRRIRTLYLRISMIVFHDYAHHFPAGRCRHRLYCRYGTGNAGIYRRSQPFCVPDDLIATDLV